MSHDASGSALQLRPGIRVSRRGDGQLQVGLHPDERAVVPDTDDVHALLRDLAHGVRSSRVAGPLATVVDALRARGLVVPVGEAGERARRLAAVTVGVTAGQAVRAPAVRMLAAAGLQLAGRRSRPDVLLLVTTGAEPRRDALDQWVRDDRPHLTLTSLGGRTRLGPFVAPGLTACLRCVDEHLTDHDPRHPLVLEQHHEPDLRDTARPEDLQLALAWAVRDLARWAEGGQPVTWSATVELEGDVPVRHAWWRHPRCGCAWGDALTG
jgi:hypothetical protein